jgi:hypothetical protein
MLMQQVGMTTIPTILRLSVGGPRRSIRLPAEHDAAHGILLAQIDETVAETVDQALSERNTG